MFRGEVQSRPRATDVSVGDLEPCIGCMVNTANIKLERRCGTNVEAEGQEQDNGERCVSCYCRPMWCIDCMAKWYEPFSCLLRFDF